MKNIYGVCVRLMCMWNTHLKDRRQLWNWLSPSPFMQVPRIKLRSSDLWDKHLHLLSHLFNPALENMIFKQNYLLKSNMPPYPHLKGRILAHQSTNTTPEKTNSSVDMVVWLYSLPV